ncbi:MAG: hypothetical protein HC889_00585 [Synechococcaceae cyanobacterium SM1_2_3]|nr:hypothetical protein [Synechococcaceae cyanobacterium SM1_2_3]
MRPQTIGRWRDAKCNPSSKSLLFVLDKYGYTIGLIAKETGLPVRDLAAHMLRAA